MLLSPNHKPSGFTLIELLVVISIISLLSSTVLTAISGIRNQARIAAGKRFETSIRSSISNCSVAFYNFEGSGSIIREAGGTAPDGTAYGNPQRVKSVDGLGKALDLDGTNDWVSVGNDKSLQFSEEMTISVWVNYDADDPDGRVLSKGANNYALKTAKNDINFKLTINGSQENIYTGSNTISPNKWNHVMGTFDGQEMRVYLDGEEEATNSFSGKVNSNSNNLLFGVKTTGSSEGFIDAQIDNVRLYDCAFKQNQ